MSQQNLSIQSVIRLATLVAGLCLQSMTVTSAGEIDYSAQIRPLLSDKCFQCHGPDENTREADLRLDTEDGLRSLAGPEGDYDSLLERITSKDPDVRMPPPEANKELNADDIGLLDEWLASGAVWQQHWAFIPPKDHIVPHLPDDQWSRTSIDRFLYKQMRAAGLEPSKDAAPLTLVNRLFLDLIGLPPTPTEADEWVAKIWPVADSIDETQYQALVSNLLARPAYGERWARKWLDLARYADTNGYEKDRERSIWPYRDWVIQAYNQDMPFDQFTIEQIAGDLLENTSESQLVATGFHRNTMLNEEGGIDPLEFRYHAMMDRVATTGTTWLGLTLGCCQCHTHKYDPISHTEYFQVMAFLNNADEPEYELADPKLPTKWNANRAEAETLVAQLENHWPIPKPEPKEIPESDQASKKKGEAEDQGSDKVQQPSPQEPLDEAKLRSELVNEGFEKWLQIERSRAVQWRTLAPIEAASNLPLLTIEKDQSIFASGDTAKRDDYYVVLETGNEPVTAIQLEALPDPRLPERGPGSTYYEGTRGDFFLTEIDFSVGEQELNVSGASESFAANRFGKNPVSAALSLDNDVQTGWSVHGRQGERHVAVYQLSDPIPPNTRLSIHMVFGRHFASSLGRFRFRGTSSERKPVANDFDDDMHQLLRKPSDSLSDDESLALRRTFLLNTKELATQAEKIRKLLKRPEATTTLVMRERPTTAIRPTYRHHRGEFLQAKEQVQPGVPSVLPGLGEFPANRLGFAQWLVTDKHPLTSRVFVNRTWADFFGTGLVKTVNDFGLQSDSPSHPELLDWLAVRFVTDDDWSIKSLHRRIVSSSVYRQSSQFRSDSANQDPGNRLLTYLPRTRLDAEVIRDRCLSSSGLLNPAVGGPPVRPPQPAGVTEDTFGAPKWNADEGANRYRRSIYTFQKRTAPFAMFATFDAPSGEACVAERDRSNSPLQALTLLNDAMFLEFARAVVRTLDLPADASDEAIATATFRRVLTRPPSPTELDSMIHFVSQQRERLAVTPRAAQSILDETGSKHRRHSKKYTDSNDHGRISRAAWTLLARSLYGLDEFQTRE
ncbi:MAG: PSD1 and planctomycete cytochrome C domain-containing protein [Planctomycetota bacterium]